MIGTSVDWVGEIPNYGIVNRECTLAEIAKNRLLPDRHRQRELFLCDINDVVLKDDMASMEHPFFALSTKPDITPRHYQHGNVSVSVVPSIKGLATIFDKDVLIYIVSKMKAAMNADGIEHVSQTVHFTARDLLVFTNRDVGGHAYKHLLSALERLAGTRIQTTIETGGENEVSGFGLIEKYKVRAKRNGRITEWSVTLSDWLFRAVQGSELLTINNDYFQIRKPLDRRIYELARKHCGAQSRWSCGLATLHKKSGSRSELK